ncbi:MAG: serine/threonine-protein kinase [Myxococcota bacterium]
MTSRELDRSAGSQPADFAPQPFGKYFLVDKIATGGMAEIFKAKTYSHGGFENLLVIKRILPHIGENQDFVGMFVDEAKISVALQHPNIVRVFDFGKILENYFIAMECVDGKDLRNLLRKLSRRKQWIPEKYAAFLIHEVCKGLAYAHTKADIRGNPFGIVHRDISPSNVLVSYEGEVKVADFGIAKAERNAYQTRDGMLKGKFEYMSPEQAGGKEIDSRSDLFSVGIILYEMLVQKRLFKSDSEIATLKRIREEDIVPPRSLKPSLSPALEAICLRALSREADERYQTAQEMADELREFLYPDTADTLRHEFAAFLQGLFTEEMADERNRLESNNAIALQIKERQPAVDWDASASELTMTQVTQTAVRFVVPWIAAIGLGMLLMFGVALVGVLYVAANNTELFGITSPAPEVPAPTVVDGPTGLDVFVSPPARILIDGAPKGEGASLKIEDLTPGTYLVRFEADGYVPVEEAITVEAGKLVKLAKKLDRIGAAPAAGKVKAAPPAPPTASGPPRVDFRSVPPGATVSVDGKEVGVAPVSWGDGQVGANYVVEMRLAGYETRSGTLTDVKKGAQKFQLTLSAVSAPATLSVVLVGGGWANVYVDGEKVPKTAPLKEFAVSPGRHEVRVENAGLGVDVTETHTFTAGQPTTVRIKTQ